jgi:hypothetical protein
MSTSLCERHYPLCQPFETVPMTLVNVSVKEFLESDSSHVRYMYFTSKRSHWQNGSDFFCEGPHVLCTVDDSSSGNLAASIEGEDSHVTGGSRR